MYEQQLAGEASQIANAIERNDINTASQLLFNDTQGLSPREAGALIARTNAYTSQDGAANGYRYDQIVSNGQTDQNGLPMVTFYNSDNAPDAVVTLNVAQDQPQPGWNAPPPPVWNAPPPELPPQAWAPAPPAYEGGPQPYYENQPYNCGPSTAGGAMVGAALGALLGGRRPGTGAVAGALIGGTLGAGECQ